MGGEGFLPQSRPTETRSVVSAHTNPVCQDWILCLQTIPRQGSSPQQSGENLFPSNELILNSKDALHCSASLNVKLLSKHSLSRENECLTV